MILILMILWNSPLLVKLPLFRADDVHQARGDTTPDRGACHMRENTASSVSPRSGHGLRRRPFPATPDLSCYYPAGTHESALVRLRQGLAEGEGVLLLSGPPGSGKTLLGHALLDDPGTGCISVFLTHGCFSSRSALLQAILYDLGLPHQGKADHEMRLALTDHVLQNYAAGKKTLVLIDEAHYLTVEALEELRLLGNLEGRAGKATQFVLIGSAELRPLLDRPELTSLRQRVAVRVQLEPLGLDEAADYLLHHIRLLGDAAEVGRWSDEGVELLVRNTHGVPRLLNQAAHLALGMANEAGMPIDVEVAMEALATLGLPGEASSLSPTSAEGDGPVLSLSLDPEEPGLIQAGIEPTVVSEDGKDNLESESPRLFVAPGQLG
jgi:type II secretory pathway predicted ATPase ExeA